MRFKSIEIKNFRNFAEITVEIGNKNVFFGMNDIGKTNFLSALRYLFDRDIRKRDLIDSDFHKRNVAVNIEVTVCIDITNTDSPDTQKLRAKLKGANEKHNSLIRRFLPKGTSFADLTPESVARIQNWCNNLPRKILGYLTPLQAFHAKRLAAA